MRLQGMGGPVDVQSCSNGVESCENGCAGGMRDRASRERLGQAAWPMRLQGMAPGWCAILFKGVGEMGK